VDTSPATSYLKPSAGSM